MRPRTITDFKRLGVRKLRRGGRTADEAFALHTRREADRSDPEPMGFAAWFLVRAKNPETTSREHSRPRSVRTITLGQHSIDPRVYRRAKNWRSDLPSIYPTRELAFDCGRYSNECNYPHYEYQHRIESWGFVVHGHLP